MARDRKVVPGAIICETCQDGGIVSCPACDDQLDDAGVCSRCWDFGEITCPDCRAPDAAERLGAHPDAPGEQ